MLSFETNSTQSKHCNSDQDWFALERKKNANVFLHVENLIILLYKDGRHGLAMLSTLTTCLGSIWYDMGRFGFYNELVIDYNNINTNDDKWLRGISKCRISTTTS